MRIEFNNIKDGRAIAARRREYLAEVQRQKTAQAIPNNQALAYVAGDAKFGTTTTVANEGMAAADEALKGAPDRRLKLEKAVKEHRDLTGSSREVAIQAVWKQHPELVGYMPKPDSGQQGVVGNSAGATVKPYLQTRLTGATA